MKCDVLYFQGTSYKSKKNDAHFHNSNAKHRNLKII